MKVHKLGAATKRGAAVVGLAAAAMLTLAPTAGAEEAAPAVGSCPTPVLTAIPADVMPGTKVTVSGKNFGGCTEAQEAAAATNTVQIGIATDQKVGTVLATVETSSDDPFTFTATVTIPDVPSAGDTIALAAGTEDSKTGLTYFAVLPLQYTGGSATPTGVPAGTGGFGLSDDDSGNTALTVAGGVGLALAGAGALGLRRRKASAHV